MNYSSTKSVIKDPNQKFLEFVLYIQFMHHIGRDTLTPAVVHNFTASFTPGRQGSYIPKILLSKFVEKCKKEISNTELPNQCRENLE